MHHATVCLFSTTHSPILSSFSFSSSLCLYIPAPHPTVPAISSKASSLLNNHHFALKHRHLSQHHIATSRHHILPPTPKIHLSISATMCYQVVERYSVCRCLYYKHSIDPCSAYGQRGHMVQEKTVLVGYACASHSSHRPETFHGGVLPDSGYGSGAYTSERR